MSDSVGMSFKAKMNNLAKKLGLRPQTVIQNYMFERFLARLAQSPYRENFVVKGGVLIAAMIGLKARSTMDMDTTVIGLPMTQRSIRHAIGRIAAEDLGDDVAISVVNMGRIRIQVEGYEGIRARLLARFHGLRVPFSVDVTKGDAITPKPELLSLASNFSAKTRYPLLAYTIETVLAEKCESILKRNVIGTRPRDYYDIYMLTSMCKVRRRVFKAALRSTFEKCGTSELLKNITDVLNGIANSAIQNEYWRRYQQEFPYAKDISFEDAVAAVRKLLNADSSQRS